MGGFQNISVLGYRIHGIFSSLLIVCLGDLKNRKKVLITIAIVIITIITIILINLIILILMIKKKKR
jgi:membrane protein DedA with SNARE-associated domain